MIASNLWVRMFFEKSLPSVATLGLNYAFVYASVTSGKTGTGTLVMAMALSLLNFVLMCRQRALAQAFISDMDPMFKKAFIGLQNVVFSCFGGIGLTMVTMMPLVEPGVSGKSVLAALISAGLILFWGQVFIRSAEMK